MFKRANETGTFIDKGYTLISREVGSFATCSGILAGTLSRTIHYGKGKHECRINKERYNKKIGIIRNV